MTLVPFRRSLKRLGEACLDFCLPRRCAGCEEVWLPSSQGFWCAECFKALSWIESPLCSRCGRPYGNSPESLDHWCGECLLEDRPFDTARSAVEHSGAVRRRIHELKFGARLEWVPSLVQLLTEVLAKNRHIQADVIVPVPLHTRRLRQRGFNQAGLLAERLGRECHCPVRFDVLARKHWTEPQTRLKREDRRLNVKGAFEVTQPLFVKNREVLLIDDVFTTGTTISECARALKNADAAQVHVLTVSRALPEWRPEQESMDADTL